jgi:hypothetical protein
MVYPRATLGHIAIAIGCMLSSGCPGESPPVAPAAPTTALRATAPPDATHAPDTQSPSATASVAASNIPPGSGDYSAVLALATRYKNAELSFAQLQEQILARRLPPHKFGDAYLMIPVPKPPPGSHFDPRMMPKDWEGSWGEVAMIFWLGKLTRAEYDKLHRRAHPDCVHE